MTVNTYIYILFLNLAFCLSDGIYDDPLCSSASVNHAMVVIGFGKDYWILKNWWGQNWGENGYIRIRKESICAELPIMPLMQLFKLNLL